MEQFRNSTKQLRVLLDAKYEKSDLNKVTENQFQHLTEVQHNELLKLKKIKKELFDGKLDTWKTDPV